MENQVKESGYYKAGGKPGLHCPFCNEQGDFDAIGLKYHLEVYCTEFQNTKQL